MIKNLLLNKYVFFLISITVAYGAGVYFSPDKVTKKYDPRTGKLIEETVETGSKESTKDVVKKNKTKETSKNKKQWAAKGGVVINPRDPGKLIPRIGAEMRLPLFSSWIGLEADIDIKEPKLGAYLRFEF